MTMQELEMMARKKFEREFNVLAKKIDKVERELLHSKMITFFLRTRFGIIIINAIEYSDGNVKLDLIQYGNKELEIIKSM